MINIFVCFFFFCTKNKYSGLLYYELKVTVFIAVFKHTKHERDGEEKTVRK